MENNTASILLRTKVSRNVAGYLHIVGGENRPQKTRVANQNCGSGGKAIIIHEKLSCNNKSVGCPEKLGSFLSRKLEKDVTPKVDNQLPDNAVDHNVNKVFIETFDILTEV